MTTFRRLCLLLLCALSPLVATAAVDSEALAAAYQRGNQAAAAEDFPAAVEAYAAALALRQSPNLHYNLANAHARLEAWGPAILHYHKALALDPQMVDARANLLLTRNRAGLEAPESSFLRRWAEQLPLTVWSLALIFAFWMLLALWLFLGRNGSAPRLRLLGVIGCVLLLGASLPALFGYHLAGQEGVVLTAETPLRVAPTSESPTAGDVPAGSLAHALRRVSDYFLVETSDGRQGYLTTDEFALIWDVPR